MNSRSNFVLGAAVLSALLALAPAAADTDYDNNGRGDIAFHQPGGAWQSVPLLFSTGSGTWLSQNYGVPSWAHAPGVVALPGDYDGDGDTDVAFHRPGSNWTTVPMLLSKGNGNWMPQNGSAPAFAHQPDVIAVPGDYNGDGTTDLAFHRPGSGWTSVPVLLSNGSSGTWTAVQHSAPSWAHQPGAIAISGDFDGDGDADLAFHRPGSTWASVPVLLSIGNGKWSAHNDSVPSWGNQMNVMAIAGDYDGDGRTDIAFHRPGGPWQTVPVLFSNGNGSWQPTNDVAPSWANQPDVVALPGDYDGDGDSDLAFHRPGGGWNTVPILFSNRNGSWGSSNHGAPSWANALGARAVREYSTRYDPGSVFDGGDVGYDWTPQDSQAHQSDFAALTDSLVLAPPGPIQIQLPPSQYHALQDTVGLTGNYTGYLHNNGTTALAQLMLRDAGGVVDGQLLVREETLVLDGGICGDTTIPISVLPVHLASSGPSYPSQITMHSTFTASGSTMREVTMLGIFSGQVVTTFQMTLYNTTPQFHSWLSGTITINAPNPCRDQSMNFYFERDNDGLFDGFRYP